VPNDKGYQAVVEKIISDGRHGPYVVARSEELASITFSLDSKVWQEQSWPEPGTFVMLYQVIKKRAGWRAQYGRFVKPSDI
jgi:hypothetical protein